MSSGSTAAANNNQDFFQDKTLPDNWNTMSAEEKRRHERNVREQQRSYQISQQIKELRALLTESNIPFKPNKYSILVSIAQYIQQLQARAIMLDAEHRKLIDTIRQTGEMVNSGQAPPADEVESNSYGIVGNDSEMLLVQGLDYRLVFDQCSAALGVTSLDGRIIDCNTELLNMFGCTKEHVLTKTVFDLVDRHEEVYQAMGQMLKREVAAATSSAGAKRKAQDSVEDEEFPSTPLYWSGLVSQKGGTVSWICDRG
jgi:PAS domain-containing protein